MVQKLRSRVFIVIGIIAIILSFKCYMIDDLDYQPRSTYGGDAYTGIQNAAAMTSKNVKELASIVQFGFGSVLLVMGMTLVGVGMTTPTGSHPEKSESVTGSEENAAETKETSTEV